MNTELKEIPGFPGYAADKSGDVYSLERILRNSSGDQRKIPFRKLRPWKANGYLKVCLYVDGKTFCHLVHRLIAMTFLDIATDQQVDHINRDRADNRLENLRIATSLQNQWNSPGYRNGFKGVQPNKSGFMARIKVSGKDRYLGTFRTERAAHEAYCVAARKLHGDFYFESTHP